MIAVLSSTQLTAQVTEVELENVIVTATRTERPEEELPRSTSIITREEIEEGSYSTISEVLSQEAGIFVVGANQNPGQVNTLFMRGTGSNQSIIMIDGVRMTDPSGVSNAVDLMELSLSNIEQIEVVRGAHSVIYGGSAIGGVINIITRKQDKPGLSVETNPSGGTFGDNTFEWGYDARVSYQTESGLYLSIDAASDYVNGMDATVDTITDPSVYNERDLDDFQRSEYQGKVGYNNEVIDLWWSYKVARTSSDVDDGAFMDDDNSTVDWQRDLISYGVNWTPKEHIGLSLNGGYSSMERIAIDDSSFIDPSGTYDQEYFRGEYTGTTLSNDLVFNMKTDYITLVAGAGGYFESMNNKTYTYLGAWAYEADYDLDTINPKATMVHGFVNATLHSPEGAVVLENVFMDLGVRYTNHSLFGANTTYQWTITGVVQENTAAYASLTTGFNAPSLYRLYEPTEHWMSEISRGNLALQPETSLSLETGLKYWAEHMRAQVAMFYSKISDGIEYVYLWDGSKDIDSLGFGDDRGDTYINLSEQRVNGIEASGEFRINEKWSVSGNVSVMITKAKFDPENASIEHTEGHHIQLFESGAFLDATENIVGLTRRANTANFTLKFTPVENLTMYGGMRYVSPRVDVFYDGSLGPFGALNSQMVDEFVLYDAGVFLQMNSMLSAGVRVNNILDRDYTEIFGYSTRGRGVFLTMRFRY